MRKLTHVRQILSKHICQTFDILTRLPLGRNNVLSLLHGIPLIVVFLLSDVDDLLSDREKINLEPLSSFLGLSSGSLLHGDLVHNLVQIDEGVLLLVLDNFKLQLVQFFLLKQEGFFQLPVPGLELGSLLLSLLQQCFVVLVAILHRLEFLSHRIQFLRLLLNVVVRAHVVLLELHV